jgi:speckle-type POZ protein
VKVYSYGPTISETGRILWHLGVGPSAYASEPSPPLESSSVEREPTQQKCKTLSDSVAIEFNVNVVVESRVVSEPETMREIQVPPSDLSEHLGKLLEGEGADVTFEVKGEVFRAHKAVLPIRSPVLKAELWGPVGKKNRRRITVEDMEPAVFKALLPFIYTDSLPASGDLDGDGNDEIVEHLLVAADRYTMERMRLTCESILCRRLDVENVAATLALADRHYCCKLKDACIRFINSGNRIKGVMASQGYEHLKKTCPSIVMDLLEEAAKTSVC